MTSPEPPLAQSMPQVERRSPDRMNDAEFVAAYGGRPWGWIAALVVAALVGVGAGIPIGFVLDDPKADGGTPTKAAPRDADGKESVPPGKHEGDTVTMADIEEFGSNPQDYVGAEVDGFVGRVITSQSGDGGWNATVSVAEITIDVLGLKDRPTGGYLSFDGEVVDVSAFDGKLYPKVEASSTKPATAIDTRSAATRTVDVDETVEFEGIEVTISKVEFADDETRVFLTAENTSDDAARVLMPTAVSGTDELGSSPVYVDYPRVDGLLRPGAKSPGVYAFEPADPGTKLTIEVTPAFDDFELPMLDEPLVVTVPPK